MTRRTTGKILIEGLYTDGTRHGTRRWFDREGRDRGQLRDEAGTANTGEPPLPVTQAVIDAHQRARDALRGRKPRVNKTSLQWLIDTFLDQHMIKRDSKTCADARSALNPIRKKYGERRYAGMERKHVKALMNEVGGNPGNKRLKYLRQLFDWAIDEELATANPAAGIRKIHVASEGYATWLAEDIHQFEERHPIGTKARLALALFLYTGQRVSDVCRLGPLQDRGDRLLYIQQKGRSQRIVRRDIPIVQPLRDALDASDLGSVTWLETEYGRPFTIKGLGNKMRQWCDEAELKHLSAHGIRKATGAIAAERGCTAHQIMEILGVSLKIAATYTRAADAKRLADQGFEKTFGGGS